MSEVIRGDFKDRDREPKKLSSQEISEEADRGRLIDQAIDVVVAVGQGHTSSLEISTEQRNLLDEQERLFGILNPEETERVLLGAVERSAQRELDS